MNETDAGCILRACGLRKEYGKEDGLVRAVHSVGDGRSVAGISDG